jgi:hypothetical protein
VREKPDLADAEACTGDQRDRDRIAHDFPPDRGHRRGEPFRGLLNQGCIKQRNDGHETGNAEGGAQESVERQPDRIEHERLQRQRNQECERQRLPVVTFLTTQQDRDADQNERRGDARCEENSQVCAPP